MSPQVKCLWCGKVFPNNHAPCPRCEHEYAVYFNK